MGRTATATSTTSRMSRPLYRPIAYHVLEDIFIAWVRVLVLVSVPLSFPLLSCKGLHLDVIFVIAPCQEESVLSGQAPICIHDTVVVLLTCCSGSRRSSDHLLRSDLYLLSHSRTSISLLKLLLTLLEFIRVKVVVFVWDHLIFFVCFDFYWLIYTDAPICKIELK